MCNINILSQKIAETNKALHLLLLLLLLLMSTLTRPPRGKRSRQKKQRKEPMLTMEVSEPDVVQLPKRLKQCDSVDGEPMEEEQATSSKVAKSEEKPLGLTMTLVHHPAGEVCLMVDTGANPISLAPGVIRFSVSQPSCGLSDGIFYRACVHPQDQGGEEPASNLFVEDTTKKFTPRLFCIARHDAPGFLAAKQQGFLCTAFDESDAMMKMGKLLNLLKGSSSIRHHKQLGKEVYEIVPQDFTDGMFELP